jgi:hypothetical protein
VGPGSFGVSAFILPLAASGRPRWGVYFSAAFAFPGPLAGLNGAFTWPLPLVRC